MHSEWSLRFDASRARCVATRSWRAMLAPYAVMLALTIAYYPLAGIVLSFIDVEIATFAIMTSLPILGMVAWVPRLARERRRIVMTLDDTCFTIQRTSLDRARLLEVVLLPHGTLFGARHRVFITYALGDFANMIAIASERRVEAARGLANELARWLAIPLSAATSSPPQAIVITKP